MNLKGSTHQEPAKNTKCHNLFKAMHITLLQDKAINLHGWLKSARNSDLKLDMTPSTLRNFPQADSKRSIFIRENASVDFFGTPIAE